MGLSFEANLLQADWKGLRILTVFAVANVRGPARARGGIEPGTTGEALAGAGAGPGGGRRKAEKR